MNEQQRERATKYRVGIFVLVSLAVFLGIIYMLGARARLFESRYTVHTDFTEVGGLQPGATVRLAGVQIGRVSEVALPSQPGGKVRVSLTIARQFSEMVRKDSVATIQTQGLLGDRIVEITVGTTKTAAVRAGETVNARDPVDISHVIGEGAGTVRSVAALAESLKQTAETFQQSRVLEELTSTVTTARQVVTELGRDAGATVKGAQKVTEQVARIVERVEKGPGLAHTLLYEEPIALRRVNDLLASTQALIDRVQRGEGAVGVLTSEESTKAARRLVAAMDRFGALADPQTADDGLLTALLFDPKYKSVLDDLQRVAHNFREVSDRLAGGRGTLGGLLKDESPDGAIQQTTGDFQATMSNLRSITDKLNEGEGTLGALIVDPTIYERLAAILDGASRSFLLRRFIRGLGSNDGKRGEGEAGR
jgi:phospholipid/cholesterol/gamma-HCH transport system substrate-binding protein